MASGNNTTLGFGVEASWGTAATISKHIPIISESLKRSQGEIYDPSLRGSRSRYSTDRKPGIIEIAGDFQTAGYISGLEPLFLAAFGKVVTATALEGATIAKKHTFTLDENLKSMSIEKRIGATFFKYTGLMISQLRCSAEAGRALQFTWSVIGKDEANAETGATVSYPAANSYFYCKQASLTIDGTPVSVPRVEWTLDNALHNRGPALGSLVTRGIKPGLRNVTGTVVADFDDATQYNKFVEGTPAALVLAYEDDSTIETISGTAIKAKLTVTLPTVFYTGETPTTSGPDEIPQNLPFTAYNDGTNAEIKLELINSTATVEGA